MTVAAPPPADPEVPAITFRFGTDRFAVPLSAVAEVGRVPKLTRVPGLPAWLAGVANWRGRVLPVVELRDLLGVTAASTVDTAARLLVFTDGGISVGVLVDHVEGTSTLPAEVAAVPPGLAAAAGELLRGQVVREDGPVAVLDVAAVFRLRHAIPSDRKSA